MSTDRERMNYHLGDALHHVERALSANQGKRESDLREAIGAIQHVLREERENE